MTTHWKATWDPNPTTRAYLEAHPEDLSATRLSFGTAGLRAAMGPGSHAMNELVALQTAQGLVQYCGDLPKIVVIGYDHRSSPQWNVSSRSMALYSALVFHHAGWTVHLYDRLVVTPLVPFGVGYYGATLGIMVTASHNPARDAGYKVYWKDGCQIRSPLDEGMAACILDNLEPWKDYAAEFAKETTTMSSAEETDKVLDAYFQAIRDSGLVVPPPSDDTHVKIAYTALHGVGYPFLQRAFEAFGLDPVYSLPSQQDPDPAFPTVAFPNPEEPGALDAVQAFASDQNCPIILANDPDADRLAVSEQIDGIWHTLSGDQVGLLLAQWLHQQQQTTTSQPLACCASTVSSQLLRVYCESHHIQFVDTLTGFKWIGSQAQQLSQNNEGYHVLLAYEEALGYCCGGATGVWDKDGLTAAGVLAQLVRATYAQQQTLHDVLDAVAETYGHFVSKNGYRVLEDVSLVPELVNAVTKHQHWDQLQSIGGYAVTGIRYLGDPGGYDSSTIDQKPTLPTSASSPLVTYRFANGCVVHLRASGTEPKFKYYMELRGQPGVRREEVEKELDVMQAVLLREFGLV